MNLFHKIGNFGKPFSKHRRRVIGGICALLILFLIYKIATREPSGIITSRVYRKNLVSSFSSNGKIKAKNEVNLKFYSPGKVSWLGVKTGDKVKKGQAVASLDKTILSTAYQQAQNNLRNSVASADSILDSVQGRDTDETFAMRATRTNAEVGRDNAYENILAARSNLSNATLVSPINGSIVDTNNITVGINLSGSDLDSKFIRIVDFESMYFEANVDEIDFSKVKMNQDVDISVDAYPGVGCTGHVNIIGDDGQETSGGVVTIPVEISLDDCNINFVTKLNGTANFVTDMLENVLVVPKKYIVNKNDRDYVWKQKGNSPKDRLLVTVTLGVTSSTEVEVKDGLSEGDVVVFIPS